VENVSKSQPKSESIKVAYYSFQKRKLTFLKLQFKANRSFLLGHLLLQLLKKNDINPHYPGKEIREA